MARHNPSDQPRAGEEPASAAGIEPEHAMDALLREYFSEQTDGRLQQQPAMEAELERVLAVGNAVKEGTLAQTDISRALQYYREHGTLPPKKAAS